MLSSQSFNKPQNEVFFQNNINQIKNQNTLQMTIQNP